jgi:hypothetical protein
VSKFQLYHYVIGILGIGAFMATGGIICLATRDKEATAGMAALVAIASGAYGALASFLAQPPRDNPCPGNKPGPTGEKAT